MGDVRHYRSVDYVILTDDGRFPNNGMLPLLLYRGVLPAGRADARRFQELFQGNGWGGSWLGRIYQVHHYHSTAHEVLGVCEGWASLQLGGEGGILFRLQPGDAMVIPAGVAHKLVDSGGSLGVVGAYPAGQQWDMKYGQPGERPRADRAIARVPLPGTDPVFGQEGPLMDLWTDKQG
ncbi:MAG: hypothetical protein ACOC8N_06905 [Spirochaetota bacterium]